MKQILFLCQCGCESVYGPDQCVRSKENILRKSDQLPSLSPAARMLPSVLLLHCLLAILLLRRRRSHRRWGVRPIWRLRRTEGEHALLFPQLLQDEEKFFETFRMPPRKFYELLDLIKSHLIGPRVNRRCSISAEQQLAVCLR